jgi:hypothetical protein
MHSYHRIAVEADNPEEAVALAQEFSNQQAWSDWNNVGNPKNPEMVFSYESNPTKFVEEMNKAWGWTEGNISEAVKKYGDITLRELLTDPKYDFANSTPINTESATKEEKEKHFDEYMAIWKVGKAFSILNKNYTQDTMFYDASYYSIEPTNLKERIVTDPDRQWIVIVDYHH